MDTKELLQIISDAYATREERLEALRAIAVKIKSGELKPDAEGNWVNNHIHTTFSFSPYTPASAVFYAWKSGLKTAGIMDHDSVGGAEEFIEAGSVIGMPVTVGFECRVSVKGTTLEGRRLNNPDQVSCAYLAMHGIPHQSIAAAEAVLAPLRAKRNERNAKMCARISEMTAPYGLTLDFEQDVLPLSQYKAGGSVTERHVLFALAKKITTAYPVREEALALLEKLTHAPLSDKNRDKLLTAPDSFYDYDILGILKSHMVEHFYIPADEECMHISEFTALQKKLGAVSAYAYLGDVGESVTGDKKAQTFEDAFLDELFDELARLDFCAVTYMPSRNTDAQLARVMKLCDAHGFFQISGEDINSPRQSFICPALERKEFAHLNTATYALIGHENAATACLDDAMFADAAKKKYAAMSDRIAHYSVIGGLR